MVTVVALCIDVANAGPYESIFDTADSLVFGNFFYVFLRLRQTHGD
jgi:hypothetical protein